MKTCRMLATVVLALYAALLLVAIAGRQRIGFAASPSDSLYPVLLLRDLIQHGSHVAWALPLAPFFFPDLLIVWITGWFASEPRVILEIAFFVDSLLLLASVLYAVRGFMPSSRPVLTLFISLAVFALFFTIYCAAPWARRPVIHRSILTIGLLLIGALVRGMRRPPRGRMLWAVGILCALGMLSDPFLLPQFVVPLVLVTASMALYHRASLRPGGAVAGAMLGGCLVGAAGWRLIWHGSLPFMLMGCTPLPATGGALHWALGFFGSSLWTTLGPIASSLFLFGLVSCLVAVALAWKSRDALGLPAIICSLVLLGTVFAPVFTRAVVLLSPNVWVVPARYLLPAALIPLFWLGLVAGRALTSQPGERLARRLALPVLVGVVLLCGAGGWAQRAFLRPALAPPDYPVEAAFIDGLCDQYHMRAGLSDYTNAKYLSTFSRRGVRVNQLTPEGHPYLWVTNANWYFDANGRALHYQFIITDRLDRAALEARFGKPDIVVKSPGPLGRSPLMHDWGEPVDSTTVLIYRNGVRDPDGLAREVNTGMTALCGR